MDTNLERLMESLSLPDRMLRIAEKVIRGSRIDEQEALHLFDSSNLPFLGVLAVISKRRQSGDFVYFNKNFHLEPTNICINHCKFCSFRRDKGQKGAWECTVEEMIGQVEKAVPSGVTEVHIVGGVHPERDVVFYSGLLREIKKTAPSLHIKAFTAVEIDQMCRMAGLEVREGLIMLREAGLDSLPGGGAEIFDEVLRAEISPDKTSSKEWLNIHRIAHRLNIPTNATMLYGLKESHQHRIDHMTRLRDLQDETHGFNCFIPLKFKRKNNQYSSRHELPVVEELRNYAVARIYLDNIPHLKAYWPMTGKLVAQISLNFGVDDLDGTVDDSTKIYSMAGSDEQNPSATTQELIHLIKQAKFVPAQRDTLYHIIETY